jgi:hypothetical protein
MGWKVGEEEDRTCVPLTVESPPGLVVMEARGEAGREKMSPSKVQSHWRPQGGLTAQISHGPGMPPLVLEQ